MTPAVRATTVLAGVLAVHAAIGLFLARDLDFSGPRGAFVGSVAYELIGTSHSPLGALVAGALALAALAGALTGRPALVWFAAAGHLVILALVVVQFGGSTNWLGARGSNLAVAIAGVAGFATLAWAMGVERDDGPSERPGVGSDVSPGVSPGERPGVGAGERPGVEPPDASTARR